MDFYENQRWEIARRRRRIRSGQVDIRYRSSFLKQLFDSKVNLTDFALIAFLVDHCPPTFIHTKTISMTSLPPLSTSPFPPPPGSSDPLNSFLSTTCLDLLLIEVVAQAKRLASQPLPLADSIFLDTNTPATTELDDDAEKENMYYRLEPMGFRVGQGIAERSST